MTEMPGDKITEIKKSSILILKRLVKNNKQTKSSVAHQLVLKQNIATVFIEKVV
jgi:hypothetical protein